MAVGGAPDSLMVDLRNVILVVVKHRGAIVLLTHTPIPLSHMILLRKPLLSSHTKLTLKTC